MRLLQRIEVRALDILDQRDLKLLLFVSIAHYRGDGLPARHHCGAQSALPGHERVVRAGLHDDDGLQETVLSDRIGQLLQLVLVERPPRLIGVWL